MSCKKESSSVTIKSTALVVSGVLSIVLLYPTVNFFGMMLVIKIATALGVL